MLKSLMLNGTVESALRLRGSHIHEYEGEPGAPENLVEQDQGLLCAGEGEEFWNGWLLPPLPSLTSVEAQAPPSHFLCAHLVLLAGDSFPDSGMDVFKPHVPESEGLLWWLSGKESTCQFRRPRFHPRVRKIPWRRKWLIPKNTHSSVLAWGIPWTEKPGGLQSMGSQESDMTEQLKHHHHLRNMSTHFLHLLPWVCRCRLLQDRCPDCYGDDSESVGLQGNVGGSSGLWKSSPKTATTVLKSFEKEESLPVIKDPSSDADNLLYVVRCNYFHTGLRNGTLPFLCWPRNRAYASSKVTVSENGKHHFSSTSHFFSFPMLSPALLFSPSFSYHFFGLFISFPVLLFRLHTLIFT